LVLQGTLFEHLAESLMQLSLGLLFILPRTVFTLCPCVWWNWFRVQIKSTEGWWCDETFLVHLRILNPPPLLLQWIW
jgi:hypothetical protein